MALKARQLELIEAMMANPLVPDTELAKKIGINRNTVREWKNKQEFQDELKARLAEKWKDSERIAMETMQMLAIQGDYRASKYILDSQGYAPAQKVEADVKSTIINLEIEE